MRVNDALMGGILALFAVAVWAYSGTFPEMHGQGYGPSLFPRIIAAGLFVCGMILIVGGLRKGAVRPWVRLDAWSGDGRRLVNLLLIPGGLIAYILVAESLGFIVVAFALLLVLLWRNGVRLGVAVLVATTATAVIHTLFYQVLHVPLPWGVLENYAW